MASPAVGVRRGFAPRAASVDWSHPLASALTECWLADSHPSNLAHGVGATTTSTPDHAVTPYGSARLGANGTSVDLPSRGLPFSHDGSVSRPCTMRVIFTPISWPSGYTALVDRGTAGEVRDFSVFISTSGGISYFTCGRVGTAYRVLSGFAGNEGLTVGRTWDFVITYDGGVVATSYVNGKRAGATSSGLTVGTSPTSANWVLGRNPSGGGANANANYHAFMAWTRELSAADVARLYAEPYCFLRY